MYIIVIIAFLSAITCGWAIVSFLEKNSLIKKNTPLQRASWSAFYRYYQIKKERDGNYGPVGIIYLISISILLLFGIVYLPQELMKPL